MGKLQEDELEDESEHEVNEEVRGRWTKKGRQKGRKKGRKKQSNAPAACTFPIHALIRLHAHLHMPRLHAHLRCLLPRPDRHSVHRPIPEPSPWQGGGIGDLRHDDAGDDEAAEEREAREGTRDVEEAAVGEAAAEEAASQGNATSVACCVLVNGVRHAVEQARI